MARWLVNILQTDLLAGLSLTLRNMFRPLVTERYPETPATLSGRFRGAQILKRRPDGGERCVGCGLCAAICPSRAIALATSMGPDGGKRVDGYAVDLGLCVYCGFCQEVCPVDAVFMGREFELAVTDPGRLRRERAQMLAAGERPEYGKL
jgi:NADH-quinone oxidoreductase subunit I